mmetsp:Transcript_18637/g.43098  ORF Transcript_18637/g.43098 Transcript_18637/m.43098 type:complete len:232 (-) Transcript_18637:1027-1722(-)
MHPQGRPDRRRRRRRRLRNRVVRRFRGSVRHRRYRRGRRDSDLAARRWGRVPDSRPQHGRVAFEGRRRPGRSKRFRRRDPARRVPSRDRAGRGGIGPAVAATAAARGGPEKFAFGLPDDQDRDAVGDEAHPEGSGLLRQRPARRGPGRAKRRSDRHADAPGEPRPGGRSDHVEGDGGRAGGRSCPIPRRREPLPSRSKAPPVFHEAAVQTAGELHPAPRRDGTDATRPRLR